MFNPVSILLHMLNAAILGAALYFLLYKPVRKFMKKREDEVTRQLSDAKDALDAAARSREESERLLREAKEQADLVVSHSAELAQQRALEIAQRGVEDIKRIREEAEADIEKMRVLSQEALRDQAADLAVVMAEKLMGRGVTPEDHTRLVDALIEGM